MTRSTRGRLIRPSIRPSTRRAVLSVVAACLALGATAGPAAADNDLEGSSPTAGAKLKNAPGQVRLTFDDRIFPGSSLEVSGPQGDATDGGADVNGNEISTRLSSDLPDGRYVVSWRVSGGILGSNDGEGSYAFVVGTPGQAQPAPPAPRPSATRPAAATSTPTPSADPSPTPEATRTALSPAAVSTLRPSPGPVASAAPTAAVPRPAVLAVDSRRDEWLPPPVFWWAVIVLTATAIGAVPKLRRRWLAAHPARPRATGDTDPTPADGTALLAPAPARQTEARLTPPTGTLRTPAGPGERSAALGR